MKGMVYKNMLIIRGQGVNFPRFVFNHYMIWDGDAMFNYCPRKEIIVERIS